MKVFGRLAAAAAALSLAVTPAVAQNAASKLSLRASTAAKNSSDVGPVPAGLAFIAIAAFVGVVIVGSDPDSP